MSRWSSSNVYKSLSGELATAQERDFERQVLSLFQVIWPDMVQVPARQSWDRKGIDLLVWSDTEVLPCAVQCKGFHVQSVGAEQRRQVLDSIAAFRQSGVKVASYIVAHNRDHRNDTFLNGIHAALDDLVAAGIAQQAYIWGRRDILDRVFDAMEQILAQRVRKNAREQLDRQQRIFDFSQYFVPEVPFEVKQLIFKRFEPCKIANVEKSTTIISDAVIPATDRYRWSLLTGVAGSGKTTALLHAANESPEYTMIFVRAAELKDEDALHHGTRKLLEEIIQVLVLFDELDGVEREIHLRIASATLGKLLRIPDSRFILIVDGLDENRIYSDLRGLQMLNNQLADFRCPIILSTRTEHLHPLFGDFSTAFSDLGAGSLRSSLAAKLIELDRWSPRTILQLIERSQASAGSLQRERLSAFSQLVQNGDYTQIYGDIPLNPLFLQFLLEDVAENGVRVAQRTSLIEAWAQRKIRRDRLSAARLTISDALDTEAIVDGIMELMGLIAFSLTDNAQEMISLTESIDAGAVNDLSQKLFGLDGDITLPLLLNSFLVPLSVREARNLSLAFSLRILQEFFLARHLFRHAVDPAPYPEQIRQFALEFHSAPYTGLSGSSFKGLGS